MMFKGVISGPTLKDDMEIVCKKETESKNTCAKCLSCLGNIRESSEGRISGVLLGEVRRKACKLNWSSFVYALLARIRT